MSNFEIKADSEWIDIDGFRIAPGEAANLKEAISFVRGMQDFTYFPEFVPYHQFEVHFEDSGALRVLRQDDNVGNFIVFNFNTIDDLVATIDVAVGISVDKKKLAPSPRNVGSLNTWNTGDVIEGR